MKKESVIKIASGLLLVAGIIVAFVYRDSFDVKALEMWLSDAGSLAPFVFASIYVVATVFFLPGSVLTLLGGALFGPWWGALINLTSATIGAGVAFLISRYLASEWVAKKTGGSLKKLIEGVESEGWRFVAFVRLVPVFPFNLLNYALGLTKIRFSSYLITSFICMAPGGFAYTYLGYAGKEAVAGEEGFIQKGLIALALLAVVIFLPRLVKKMRSGPEVREVAEGTDDEATGKDGGVE